MPVNPALKYQQQLALFNLQAIGLTNSDQYSQLIGLYDQCPKGVSSRLKTTTSPRIIDRDFKYGDATVQVKLNPSLIRQQTRKKNPDYDPNDPSSPKTISIEREVFVYPSERESRIEEALIYIGSQGNLEFNNVDNRLGIYFTLGQLQAILKKRGHTMSISQIKEGIDILRLANIDVQIASKGNGKLTFTGSRIDGLIIHEREEWLASKRSPDGPEQRCFCYLHPLAASEVGMGNHTLHDYHLQAKLSSEVAKALHKRLTAKYSYADPEKEYSVSAVEFLKTTDRGLLTPRKDWQEVQKALEQLKDQDIIMLYNLDPVYGDPSNSRKVTDKIIRVWSSPEFKTFMKKANAVQPKKRDLAVA